MAAVSQLNAMLHDPRFQSELHQKLIAASDQYFTEFPKHKEEFSAHEPKKSLANMEAAWKATAEKIALEAKSEAGGGRARKIENVFANTLKVNLAHHITQLPQPYPGKIYRQISVLSGNGDCGFGGKRIAYQSWDILVRAVEHVAHISQQNGNINFRRSRGAPIKV